MTAIGNVPPAMQGVSVLPICKKMNDAGIDL
jgi:hypothetical protein